MGMHAYRFGLPVFANDKEVTPYRMMRWSRLKLINHCYSDEGVDVIKCNMKFKGM
jgi:hypothetical protein